MEERLPHGSFLQWIAAEFGMAERSTRRFLEVAKAFGSKAASVADLTPSALYELAAPKTPIEVREEVEKMIEAGEDTIAAEETVMPDETYLSKDLLLALDTYALDEKLGDRQAAMRVLLADALTRLGYLPHEPQEGTRPENLTTANDD